VTSFNHGVCLWIATGNNLAFDITFVRESVADFSIELFSFVHSHFCRPWTLCKRDVPRAQDLTIGRGII